MVASMSDKLKSTWNSASPAPTVTTGTRSAGAGTLACQSLNWPTDTAVDFATFAKNADGSVNQASVQEFTGIVSGNNLTSVTLTSGGSDQGNNIGDTVVMKPTSKGHQDLVDAVKVAHNQDGSLKDNIVTTAKIADGAVTAGKTDFSSYETGTSNGYTYHRIGNLWLATIPVSISASSGGGGTNPGLPNGVVMGDIISRQATVHSPTADWNWTALFTSTSSMNVYAWNKGALGGTLTVHILLIISKKPS